MKKLSTIIIAMALLLGMAQCKKQETPASAGKTVHITLNMGNNGSRHTVDPISGAVDYTEGDIIYVGNNGKYIGFLTADANRVFSGDIQDPSTEDYLHFYFLGGKTPATAPTAGTTESFTINIADQTDKLPVLSYAHSTVNYTDGNTMYEAELQNQCALAKFTLTQGTNEVVKVAGMNNEATVNFGTPGITATDEYGFITLNSGNETETQSGTVKYAILLPQDEVNGADVIIGETSYTPIVVPAIEASRYYGKEGDLVIDNATPAPAVPEGAINGLFSVSATQQVYFSQGNLQYIGSAATPYWKFAEHQWDYLGTTTGQNSNNQNVDRDLFGWGTSGWNNDNYFYMPYNTSNSTSSPYTSSNGYGYGPTDGSNYMYSLTESYANADWGVYNNIMAGETEIAAGTYRTLTNDEWGYLFSSRQTGKTVNGTSNARYTEATINTDGSSVNGIILFPDGYSGPTSSTDGITFGTINNSSAWGTRCTTAGWQTLEAAGCVFLPAAGHRFGTSVFRVGSHGYYWSSMCGNSGYAYDLYFSSGYVGPQSGGSRPYGYSVRLACPSE